MPDGELRFYKPTCSLVWLENTSLTFINYCVAPSCNTRFILLIDQLEFSGGKFKVSVLKISLNLRGASFKLKKNAEDHPMHCTVSRFHNSLTSQTSNYCPAFKKGSVYNSNGLLRSICSFISLSYKLQTGYRNLSTILPFGHIERIWELHYYFSCIYTIWR